MQVAQCEGVRIHNDRGRLPFPPHLFQCCAVVGKAPAVVLQKDQTVLYPRNLIKPKITKKSGTLRLGV